jgi:nucleotide-binding universal stress UspA family protein
MAADAGRAILAGNEEVRMSVIRPRAAGPPVWLGAVFDRIVCGVDGTESSRVAVQQAARLLPVRRSLELVCVVEDSPMPWAPQAATRELERRSTEARRALADAHRLYPRAATCLSFGDPGEVLEAEVRKLGATLVAVGAPRTGRLGGLVLGDVGTNLLHRAPCSVLVARACEVPEKFPRSIVAGHDGSSGAAAAAAIAKDLALRFGARLRIVAARGGDPVQVDRLALEPRETLAWSPQPPLEALLDASADADLLLVGSRGLRGLRSLGSVSERLGHLASCSVLVVRPPAAPVANDSCDDAVPDPEC